MLLTDLGIHHLRALDMLLAERSVTRAAARLGLTQSAVSHSLRQLREALDDPLFVRGSGGMVPTPRAEALALPLHRALHDLAAALEGTGGWEPSTARHRFVLSMADSFTLTVLPKLLELCRLEAPGIDIDVVPDLRTSNQGMLEAGDADVLLGVQPPDRPGLRARALFDDGFACLVRADHPELGEHLDLDTFTRLPHALISPTGSGAGVVDEALDRIGRERRVQLRIRYFLAAPLLIARSDLLLTAPTRLARVFAGLEPLKLLPPPLELPRFTTCLIWHERLHRDPAHRWLRGAVVRVCGDAE
jgi:DNA-binding transcriptional LysR family regulator